MSRPRAFAPMPVRSHPGLRPIIPARRRRFSLAERAFAWSVLALYAAVPAIAWVMNLHALLLGHESMGWIVLRSVGVVVVPLGSVLGCL